MAKPQTVLPAAKAALAKAPIKKVPSRDGLKKYAASVGKRFIGG